MNKKKNPMQRIFFFNSYANQLIICLVNIKRNIWVFYSYIRKLYSLSTAKRHIVIIDSLFYHYKRLQAMKKGTKTKGAIENNRKIQIKCLFCFLLFPSFPHLRTLHRYLSTSCAQYCGKNISDLIVLESQMLAKCKKQALVTFCSPFMLLLLWIDEKKVKERKNLGKVRHIHWRMGKNYLDYFSNYRKFSIINLLGRMKREREKRAFICLLHRVTCAFLCNFFIYFCCFQTRSIVKSFFFHINYIVSVRTCMSAFFYIFLYLSSSKLQTQNGHAKFFF